MEQETLDSLKAGKIREVLEKYAIIPKTNWPVETLLPFVLLNVLTRRYWDSEDIRFTRHSFKLFSILKCLNPKEKNECLEIFRLASFLEAVSLISLSSSSSKKIREELCDNLMKILRCKQMKTGPERRYFRHLLYLEAVCERAHRLKKFKRKASRYLENLRSKLRKRAVPLLEGFISRM